MWFVLILTSLLALSVASSPLLIDLPDGKIQGFKLNAYHAYRGIPYAAPPTGNNRWVPPQPVEPWKPAILSTTEFKANCLQPTPPCWYSINKAKESSEDCLYLDVYVPNVGQTDQNKLRSSGQNDQSRAVMVWIHGGDYQYGGSNDRETVHPPHYPEIANTIYVSVNYRLSVFGYLGAEQLRARDTLSGSTGNYGAQDQRAAIKWVKDHMLPNPTKSLIIALLGVIEYCMRFGPALFAVKENTILRQCLCPIICPCLRRSMCCRAVLAVWKTAVPRPSRL
jgi:para-nitrobenzyl esterase